MIAMKLNGGPDLAKALNALSDELKPKVLLEGLKTAAEPMRDEMARLAPRGPEAPHLADSMTISRTTKIEGVRLTEDEVAVAVGPAKDFYYGYFHEFGTVKMRARPFMRPAFDGQGESALQSLAQIFWTILKRDRGPSSGGGMR
jgi:HK97 gp10 family phage protein